jgi:hypothetical protein
MGLPLAAGLDWLEALLPLLFVGFWILSQIMTVLRKAGEAARRGPAPAPKGEPVAEIGPSSLEEEVRAFLERMGDSQSRSQSPEPPPLPGSNRPAPVRTLPVADASPPGGRSGAVGPRTRAGREPRQKAVETDVAAHVRDVFGHEMRHLSSPLAGEMHDESPALPAARAGRILSLLRSPTGLRDLVVMREILDRPPSAVDTRRPLL